MLSEKSVKRGRGRPHGVKDRKPRSPRPRLVVPIEQQVLSKREAAAVAGVGLSKIDQHLGAIGAVRSGSRVLIFRDRLMAWVHSLPPAVVPPSPVANERVAGR
jgi:excisionase family DNA binding protein